MAASNLQRLWEECAGAVASMVASFDNASNAEDPLKLVESIEKVDAHQKVEFETGEKARASGQAQDEETHAKALRNSDKVDVNQQVECESGKEARENMEAQDGENQAEELSSDSDEEYTLPMRVRKNLSFVTEQDMELRQVREIATMLRDRPLFPADPADAEALRSWVDVDSGIRLPLAHCAFRRCRWIGAGLEELQRHLCQSHGDCLPGGPHCCAAESATCQDNMAWYCAGMRHKKQQNMSLVGPSVDRRTIALMRQAYASETVEMLICFCRAAKKIKVRPSEESEISYRFGGELLRLGDQVLHLNFALEDFKRSYGDGPAFQDARDLADDVWVRQLLFEDGKKLQVLCCPEDVANCGQHSPGDICHRCRVPICTECWEHLADPAQVGVPMALSNDNFWGYMSAVVVKHEVRFIETLVAIPIWTTTSIFYVEGDRGHLLQEKMGQKRWRTAMRGYVSSFVMPWEDILRQLRDRTTEKETQELPRSPECLRYLVRFTLANELGPLVGQCEALLVRPGVVLLLLFELIHRGHEAFRGRGPAEALRQQMQSALDRHYPETEAHLPLEERRGLLEVVENETSLWREKASTPGKKPSNGLASALGNPERTCQVLDVNPFADTSFPDAQTAILAKFARKESNVHFANVTVQLDRKFIPQWHAKYFSQVMPFEIPRMVSGPDYPRADRWRRLPDSPEVTPTQFMRTFARRVELQIANSWTAIPIARSVWYKHMIEAKAVAVGSFRRAGPGASGMEAMDHIQTMQKLYHVLQSGTFTVGKTKKPINGDTSKLPFADGLTDAERAIARKVNYLASHLPGNPLTRRVMGHVQFGARVVYGDCVFMTISLNEHHSALVLRLFRARRSDPFLDTKAAVAQESRRWAGKDVPPLEEPETAACSLPIASAAMRARLAAQNPHAVMSAFQIEVRVRLAQLLGLRMCLRCPDCSCQDRFGSNMLPLGGVFGAAMALGGAIEFQYHSSPHFHFEVFLSNIYQYNTLEQIAQSMSAKALDAKDIFRWYDWVRMERPPHQQTFDVDADRLYDAWWNRFEDAEHDRK
ncbi:ATP-dependent DNA helicase [Durusdinium trenchii]|uniref:ATP-dependent DNA helicase n=1 Tax=Durusdinium trenchii TaxID=1381693 RepID=A0ABP0KC16_9DINO